jgi:hypothetical protein
MGFEVFSDKRRYPQQPIGLLAWLFQVARKAMEIAYRMVGMVCSNS